MGLTIQGVESSLSPRRTLAVTVASLSISHHLRLAPNKGGWTSFLVAVDNTRQLLSATLLPHYHPAPWREGSLLGSLDITERCGHLRKGRPKTCQQIISECPRFVLHFSGHDTYTTHWLH